MNNMLRRPILTGFTLAGLGKLSYNARKKYNESDHTRQITVKNLTVTSAIDDSIERHKDAMHACYYYPSRKAGTDCDELLGDYERSVRASLEKEASLLNNRTMSVSEFNYEMSLIEDYPGRKSIDADVICTDPSGKLPTRLAKLPDRNWDGNSLFKALTSCYEKTSVQNESQLDDCIDNFMKK